MKYSEKTLKRFTKPKFAGEIKNPDAVGEEGNLKCGDMMRIFIKVEKGKKADKDLSKRIIKDIKFQTYGCIAAIAATDALCEIAKGKTIEDAKKLTWKDVINDLGEVPPIKYHCSIMGIGALKDAIKKYEESARN